MAEAPSSARGVVWDLRDLFAGADDPGLAASLGDAQGKAEAFATRFRGTINVEGGPKPEHLLAGVQELEGLYELIGRVSSYAHLLFAADTASEVNRDLVQRVEQAVTALHNQLLFFELEWLALPDEAAEPLISNPALGTYRHYLEAQRRYKKHTLSEPEEKVINEKDQTGQRAWVRLFTELTSGLTFPLERDGETQRLTLAQILAQQYDPNRDVRKAAHESLFTVMAEHGQVLTFIYDTLIQDHLTMDRLRHYEDPMQARHLDNEVDAQSVASMMEVAEQNYGIARDYFRLKAKLLGLPKVMVYDQYAPLRQEARVFTYDQTKGVVLEALGAFSPQFADVAKEFFDKSWIDAEVRPGKRGGAFCASPSPRVHPYILCNYTDVIRDAMTVAHELGHGIHGYLARKQTPFNYHGGLPMAETASVFAEMLVFDHLAAVDDDASAQLGLIASKIEDIFATVFRQTYLTRFEQGAFAARQEARLTPEKLGDVWIGVNEQYYGNALGLTDGYRWGWSYIPHFINSRFYCYSYVFGELLVLALYSLYREQGRSFVPTYSQLLERGGSEAPHELLRPFGIDFRDDGFWQRGFQEIRRMVDRAQALAEKIGR